MDWLKEIGHQLPVGLDKDTLLADQPSEVVCRISLSSANVRDREISCCEETSPWLRGALLLAMIALCFHGHGQIVSVNGYRKSYSFRQIGPPTDRSFNGSSIAV